MRDMCVESVEGEQMVRMWESVEEAAKYLGVTKYRVRKLLKEGRLERQPVGRRRVRIRQFVYGEAGAMTEEEWLESERRREAT